jgi:hypothetical protein
MLNDFHNALAQIETYRVDTNIRDSHPTIIALNSLSPFHKVVTPGFLSDA